MEKGGLEGFNKFDVTNISGCHPSLRDYKRECFENISLELSIMINNKLTNLVELLKSMQSAVLAYSGGVDSTLLLKALQVSKIRTLAITAASDITPHNDLLMAKQMTAELGIEHRIIETDELSIEEFVSNTPERCFFCKDKRFKQFSAMTISEGCAYLIDGSNVDDSLDYRPGLRAASKYHVRSPLTEAGLSKKEIREISRQLGLLTWDQSSSSCLASRFPYGQRITKGALKRIDEAEEFLRGLGFHEVRVRDHDMVARIEIRDEEINLLLTPENRGLVSGKMKFFGYRFVSLDLDGYTMGSMNRMLDEKDSGGQGFFTEASMNQSFKDSEIHRDSDTVTL